MHAEYIWGDQAQVIVRQVLYTIVCFYLINPFSLTNLYIPICLPV